MFLHHLRVFSGGHDATGFTDHGALDYHATGFFDDFDTLDYDDASYVTPDDTLSPQRRVTGVTSASRGGIRSGLLVHFIAAAVVDPSMARSVILPRGSGRSRVSDGRATCFLFYSFNAGRGDGVQGLDAAHIISFI